MLHDIVIPILGLLGLSGIISYWLNKKKEFEFKIVDQKERRYRSSLLFMDAYFTPEHLKYLSSRHSDIETPDDVLGYLRAEYHEMLLYASPGVILSVKELIETPSRDNFFKVVLTMRKDLWIKKRDLTINEIKLK